MILSERRVASCERIDEKDTWQQLTIYLLIDRSFMPPFRPPRPFGRPSFTRQHVLLLRPPFHRSTNLVVLPVLPYGRHSQSCQLRGRTSPLARVVHQLATLTNPVDSRRGEQSAPTIGLMRVDERFRRSFDPNPWVSTSRDATGAVLLPSQHSSKFLGRRAELSFSPPQIRFCLDEGVPVFDSMPPVTETPRTAS